MNEDECEENEEGALLAVRNRRLARAAILRVLYGLDSLGMLDGATVAQTIARVVAPVGEKQTESLSDSIAFVQASIAGVLKDVLEIDRLIQQSSAHWTVPRICRVDRNILRLAVYELVSLTNTPTSVIINEALEITKQYGAPEAVAFVNGVLDRAARSIRQSAPIVKVAS